MSNVATTQSVITSDVEIIGTIKSSGSLRLDGKLEGELHCTGDAIIGKTAVIKGNINVNSVCIEGAINGNILAKDKIEMKATARVNGDIKSKRLSVEDGVTFVGRAEVTPTGLSTPSTPPPGPSVMPAQETKPEEGGKSGLFGKR